MTDSQGGLSLRTRRVIGARARTPSVCRGKRIVTGEVAIPREDLREGPWGHRVQVVDYDASLDRYRKPKPIVASDDPFKGKDSQIG